jgi:hypothetical protein
MAVSFLVIFDAHIITMEHNLIFSTHDALAKILSDMPRPPAAEPSAALTDSACMSRLVVFPIRVPIIRISLPPLL